MASSVAVSQACRAVTMSKRSGMKSARRGVGHGHVQKLHPVKAQVGRQLLRGLHQWGAGFDAVDAAPRPGL